MSPGPAKLRFAGPEHCSARGARNDRRSFLGRQRSRAKRQDAPNTVAPKQAERSRKAPLCGTRSTAPRGCEAVRRSRRRSTASPAEHGMTGGHPWAVSEVAHRGRMPTFTQESKRGPAQPEAKHCFASRARDDRRSSLGRQRSRASRQDANVHTGVEARSGAAGGEALLRQPSTC